MSTQYVVKRPTGVGVLSRGKDYSVKDLGGSQAGYTNLLKKELGVSLLADAPQTRWTQIHELSHVRHSLWSPERIVRYIAKTTRRKLAVGCVLAAEDARINEIAHRRVPDAHKGFALADRTGAGIRRDIEGYVASHASPAVLARVIGAACDPAHVAAVDAWLARLPGMAERELSVLRVTVPLALLLDDLQHGKAPESKPKPKPEPALRGEEGDEDEDSTDGAPGDGDEDDVEGEDEDEDGAARPEDEEALGEPDAAGGHACGSPMPDAGAGKDGAPRWLIPKVLEPALTVPLRGGNAMVTTAETGTSLRWASLHRIATDGVVFRHVRRRPGALQRGTVLIDVSCSMNFEDADLDAIIAAMPYATVAVYSGEPTYSRDSPGRAWVVVVARNGKRVRSLTLADGVRTSGGNTCDGPALLWLSRQASPRLWVCDGVVTSTTDRYDGGLAAQCGAIMEAGGILQVAAPHYGHPAVCVRRMMWGVPPSVPALLAAVRDLERGRVKP